LSVNEVLLWPSRALMYLVSRPAALARLAAPWRKSWKSEILQLFVGFELVNPGLIQLPYWRPDDPPSPEAGHLWILGEVGRKSGAIALT
jgi:S-adenosyl methyltransferase